MQFQAKKNEHRPILKLSLHCTLDNSTVEHDFIASENHKVSEVKDYVEKEYQIPAHCQSLYFESTLLRDEDALAKSWIREGDTIVVKYDTDADMNDVMKIIETLRMLLGVVENHSSTLTKISADRMQQLCDTTNDVRKLIISTLSNDSEQRSAANTTFFVYRGGLDVLYNLYGLVLHIDYEKAVFLVRYLENMIIQAMDGVILSYSKTSFLREINLDAAVDYTLKSFTRVPIPHHQEIHAPSGPSEEFSVTQAVQDRNLIESLERSLVSTSKYVLRAGLYYS